VRRRVLLPKKALIIELRGDLARNQRQKAPDVGRCQFGEVRK
jgi:hypothetical protein